MRCLPSTLRTPLVGAALAVGLVAPAATLAGALVAPSAASADGPGYGGTANTLIVQWQVRTKTRVVGLAIYAVGFRGGSTVTLRVGAAAERTVAIDSTGALRVLVVVTVTSTPAPGTTSSPATRSPATRSPATRSPATRSPATRSPATQQPATRSPVTQQPATRSPATRQPASRALTAGMLAHGSFTVRPFAAVSPTGPSTTVEAPADTTVLTVTDDSVGRLSPGLSVLAVGRTPEGTVRTLIGSVPPPEAGWGPQNLAPWAAGTALLAAMVFGVRRRGAMAAGVVQRYRHPARHRA